MIPVASFSYNITGLSIEFMDKSVNVPTSWLWTFGFIESSVIKTSTSRTPTIAFPNAGVFVITLVSTNADGSSEQVNFSMVVGGSPLGLSIVQMVMMGAPASFVPNSMFLDARIKFWQLYLINSPIPPIAEEDVYKEWLWPDAFNILISKLLIYDYMVSNATNFILSLQVTGSSAAKGAVKRIETGPTNTEWYNMSDYWSNILKAGTSSNIFQLAAMDACNWARQLGVWLPMCPEWETVIPLEVLKVNLTSNYPVESPVQQGNDYPVSINNQQGGWVLITY